MSLDESSVVPMVIATEFTSVACPPAICPAPTGGDDVVSPKPVANSETISPAFAGAAPGTKLGLATMDDVPAISAAILDEFGNTKNAGANAWSPVRLAAELLIWPGAP